MRRVTREILIAAPPARVWRHLVDPAERWRWLGDDLAPGDLSPGAGITATGPIGPRRTRIDEVDEGRSLTFTCDEAGHRSRVRIEVEAAGDGSRVRVTESLLTGPVGYPPPGPMIDDRSGPDMTASASLVHVA